MVSGVIQRYEGGAATVQLTNVEAILPRGEQIPGETHHVNERVRTTVFEVRKSGSRVKVILSRTRPQLVQRLFEQEIPEIADGVIQIRAMAREPGYRSKVAVSSSDPRVDCVGACVGVRGNRIKNIVDELAGERIDIVRWDDNLEVLIPNALQPAEVEQVILCKMLGRAIVLVREDQLSLAIGRRGQNVRLASKLSGWDIEIMTQEELAQAIDRAVDGFSSLHGRRSRAGRTAGRGRLPELRRPVDHRARRADGDGQPERRDGQPDRRAGRRASRSGRGGRRRSAPAEARARAACRNGGRSRHEARAGRWRREATKPRQPTADEVDEADDEPTEAEAAADAVGSECRRLDDAARNRRTNRRRAQRKRGRRAGS